MTAIYQYSALELARAIADRRLGACEALEAVLSRIERIDGALNAFALVDHAGARAAAAAADAWRGAGNPLGPLHGVPFSVKDLIDTAGIETAFGSWLMQGHTPLTDAVAVSRMKAAGAILIGKTTTPEFAGNVLTSSPRYGVTRNPWNLDRSPGGSSGGAGAAVAAGFGPLALATDGAGSARIPASCCGVLGLKPTLGRIPHERAPDLFSNFSHIGLIARTSGDLGAMLDVLSGPDAADPWSLGRTYPPSVVPDEPVAGLRAMKAVYFPRMGNPRLARAVAEVCDRALETLTGAGLHVERDDEVHEWGIDLSRTIMRATMAARMARFSEGDRARMSPALRVSIAEGEAIGAEALRAAPMARTDLYRDVERVFGKFDLILSPTLGAPPPRAEFDSTQPFEIDGKPVGDSRAGWFTYPTPFNLTGHPAISIPAGRSEDGLPIGMQAVAPWNAEQRLIDLAAAVEATAPWSERWPEL